MTDPQPARLTDGGEVLRRQVHPQQTDHGVIRKSAFVPGPNDALMLSTARGYVPADEAYRRWTEDFKRDSIGTFGISVSEIDDVQVVRESDKAVLKIHAIDDAVTEGPDHASVVFRELGTRGQREQAGRKLLAHALERGCLHAP